MSPLLLLILIAVAPIGYKENLSFKARPAHSGQPPPVAFCELLKHPELYNKKIVRTRAVFRRTGDGSVNIECPSCPGAGKVWPIFVASFDSCTKPGAAKMFNAKHPDTVLEAVMVGMFDNTHGGPMNAYPYQFQVTCAERVKLVSRGKAGGRPPKKGRRIHC